MGLTAPELLQELMRVVSCETIASSLISDVGIKRWRKVFMMYRTVESVVNASSAATMHVIMAVKRDELLSSFSTVSPSILLGTPFCRSLRRRPHRLWKRMMSMTPFRLRMLVSSSSRRFRRVWSPDSAESQLPTLEESVHKVTTSPIPMPAATSECAPNIDCIDMVMQEAFEWSERPCKSVLVFTRLPVPIESHKAEFHSTCNPVNATAIGVV